jgi:heme-degrading monooxygenase HmoA
MYMRLTFGKVKAGLWDEFEGAYKQYVEGAAATQGLRTRWLVRSTSDRDTYFTLSLWETLEDMESYERSDSVEREILPHIAPFLNGPSTAHHCELPGGHPAGSSRLNVFRRGEIQTPPAAQ